MHTEAMGGADVTWTPGGIPARLRRGAAQLPRCHVLDFPSGGTVSSTLVVIVRHRLLLLIGRPASALDTSSLLQSHRSSLHTRTGSPSSEGCQLQAPFQHPLRSRTLRTSVLARSPRQAGTRACERGSGTALVHR
ncbi:hypothetical protein OH77DRAFT_592368 [Trametes cingulata]|nr:hypothetical protein OH77DRAFT_592368 [Trametes cingulata]